MPAAVTVRTAAKPATPGGHPRLVLATAAGVRVELPHAPVEAELGPLSHRWEEVDRQGRRAPLLIDAGPQLAKLTLEAAIVNTRRPDDSVELYIYALTVLARGTDPVYVANYGTLVGNAWRITNLVVAPFRRQPGTNAITAANVTLELTAASDLRIVLARAQHVVNGALVSGGTPIVAGNPDAVAYKLITVPGLGLLGLAAPTASSLALTYYGTTAAVPLLLKLNGLRDPRQIRAGMVLKVPK